MDLRTQYLRNVNISYKVQKAAEELVSKMRNNDVNMDVLPNSYDDFTGRLELEDYLSFCQFLESRRGKAILDLVEESYE